MTVASLAINAIPDFILWEPIFNFGFIKNQWEHKILRSWLRTPILVVLVRLPLEWNTYLLFNSDIVNFVWKTEGGGEEGGGGGREGAESIVLLIFVIWRCFNGR